MDTLQGLLLAAIMLVVIALFSLWSGGNDYVPGKGFNELEKSDLEKATFAGGCFWGLEATFDGAQGVEEAISGYTGGEIENPSYERVCRGTTGHYESVRVYYHPDEISYGDLLDIFWNHIDPSDAGGQGLDRGSQYKTAIFYHDDEQKKLAEETKNQLEDSGTDVATEILPLEPFYPAEEYHQDYFQKH